MRLVKYFAICLIGILIPGLLFPRQPYYVYLILGAIWGLYLLYLWEEDK